MGQIQNSLNQLFASGIGATLAASHSPYVKGQQAIKQFDAPIKAAENVVLEGYAGKTGQFSTIEDDIENAKSLEELKQIHKDMNTAIEGYHNATKHLNDLYTQQDETILRQGTRAQKEDLLPDREERFTKTGTFDYGEQSAGKEALTSLIKAYERKKGIFKTVEQRRAIMKDIQRGAFNPNTAKTGNIAHGNEPWMPKRKGGSK